MKPDKRKRAGRKYHRGSYWIQQRDKAFERAGAKCEVSGEPLGHWAAPVYADNLPWRWRRAADHIVPERAVRSLIADGADPHILENLVVITPRLHSRKTAIEYLIFKADFLGYKRELNRLGYPPEMFEKAWKALCESAEKKKAEKDFLALTADMKV